MKKIHLQVLVLAPIIFGYSYFLISNYLYGDQNSYRALYDALSVVDFLDVPIIAERYITASDWLSFYLLWPGARLGIDKDIYISFFNTIMLLCLYVLARRHGVGYVMIALIMCNFYIIVLMTGAERLKFAFVFLFLAELVHSRKFKASFFLLSILSHLQSFILLVAASLNNYKDLFLKLLRGSLRKKLVPSILLALIFGAILFYVKTEAIAQKFESYREGGALTEGLQIAIFMAIGLIFIKNKLGFFICMLALMVGTIFIGGQRVNMIAVFLGVYFFWLERKGNHPFLFFIMVYFAFKSVPFVFNILNYGNGFHGV